MKITSLPTRSLFDFLDVFFGVFGFFLGLCIFDAAPLFGVACKS